MLSDPISCFRLQCRPPSCCRRPRAGGKPWCCAACSTASANMLCWKVCFPAGGKSLPPDAAAWPHCWGGWYGISSVTWRSCIALLGSKNIDQIALLLDFFVISNFHIVTSQKGRFCISRFRRKVWNMPFAGAKLGHYWEAERAEEDHII